MTDNVVGDNNRAGLDHMVVALEAAFEEQHEQLRQIQVTLAKLALNGNNRRLEFIRGCDRHLSQDAHIVRPITCSSST